MFNIHWLYTRSMNLVSDPVHVYCFAGDNRLRYFQLLMNGSYNPMNLPVGGEEARDVSPRSLAEAILVRNNILNALHVMVVGY